MAKGVRGGQTSWPGSFRKRWYFLFSWRTKVRTSARNYSALHRRLRGRLVWTLAKRIRLLRRSGNFLSVCDLFRRWPGVMGGKGPPIGNMAICLTRNSCFFCGPGLAV